MRACGIRGWTRAEFQAREAAQWPLEMKRQRADAIDRQRTLARQRQVEDSGTHWIKPGFERFFRRALSTSRMKSDNERMTGEPGSTKSRDTVQMTGAGFLECGQFPAAAHWVLR